MTNGVSETWISICREAKRRERMSKPKPIGTGERVVGSIRIVYRVCVKTKTKSKNKSKR